MRSMASGATGRSSSIWWMDACILCFAVACMGATLILVPALGTLGYALPIIVGLAVLALAGVATLFAGPPRAIALFMFAVTIIFDLSFRTRAVGDVGLDWQNGIKLIAWLLMLALAARYYAPWRTMINDPAVCFAVAFGIFCVLSAMWSPVGAYTFASALGGLGWMGIAFVCATRLPDVDVLKPLVWALTIECVVGLIVGFVMPDIGWLQDFEYEGSRLAGLSGHPNLLGQHAALLILIAMSARECGALKKYLAPIIVALAFLTLGLTGSRTAMIATVAAVSFVYLRHHKRLAQVTMFGATILLAVVFMLNATGTMPDLDNLFASLSRSGNASEIMTATNRSDLWLIAWHHFLERPLLGWGFNGTEQLMSGSVDSNFPGNPVNAHNLLFQALMSLGLVGSLTVIGYFGVLMSRFFTDPDPLRDRILVFSLALGVAEAELLSTPVIMSFLIFWCLFRDARNRGRSPQAARQLPPALCQGA